MRLPDSPDRHLTCSLGALGIGTIDELEEMLRRLAPAVRSRLSTDQPLGLSLMLSGPASLELTDDERLGRFRRLVDSLGLYIFTMDSFGFAPQPWHLSVKDSFEPDWQDEERLGYTFRLSNILARMLPDDMDEGSISTIPLGYRPGVDVDMPANWMVFTLNIIRVVQHLARLREETGKLIHLDLEPSPDGVLEDVDDVVRFYERWLLTQGVALLADRAGNDPALAREQIFDHVRVCLDLTHVALNYQEPRETLDRYDAAGIRIGKVHIGTAVRAMIPGDELGRKRIMKALHSLEGHKLVRQVVQRNDDGTLVTYRSLEEAAPHLADPGAREWRLHIHAPVADDRYDALGSTRETACKALSLLRERADVRHFEVETHTWDVLPESLQLPEDAGLYRELRWAMKQLNG